MLKIQWVTALVVAVSLVVWAVLVGMGKTEAAGIVTVLAMVVHALLPALLKPSDGAPPGPGSVLVIPPEAPTVPVLPSLKRMALGFGFALFVCGCASSPTTDAHLKNVKDSAEFGVELSLCRDKTHYPTYADYEACAAGLDRKYGRAGK